MILGIIGVGHLASSILKGLRRAGFGPGGIVLSPRGQGLALAREHGYALASDSYDVVERADVVLLAVRPGDAVAAVEGLPWRVDQVLMSACAGVPIARLAKAAPEPAITRIMPLTASEIGASPTLVYPSRPEVAPYLAAIGSVIALQSEEEFEAGTVSAAIYGWAQALIRSGADWSAAHGLDEATSRRLVAETFTAAGRMIAEKDASMATILQSLCTPGGITEAGLRHLETEGATKAWTGACDLVLRRLRGET